MRFWEISPTNPCISFFHFTRKTIGLPTKIPRGETVAPMNVSTMILITTSNTWNSSSEVCSGRTISGLHIGPSACELRNLQWILFFFGMFHKKEKESQQKRQFFVPAGCKAYQWVQYSQTLYCFIPRLVPKWENQGKRSSLFKDQTVQLKRFPIFLFSRALIGIRRRPHIFPRFFPV